MKEVKLTQNKVTNKLPSNLRKSVIANLMKYLQTENSSELSRVLGHNSRQHLDNCFKRGNLPTNRIINYALNEGIDLNWLFGQTFKKFGCHRDVIDDVDAPLPEII